MKEFLPITTSSAEKVCVCRLQILQLFFKSDLYLFPIGLNPQIWMITVNYALEVLPSMQHE